MKIRCILGIFLAALLGSCEAWDRRMVPIPDPASDQVKPVQFADLPVPDGMTLQAQRHESSSFEAGSFRWAEMTYKGEIPMRAALAFLRQQLKQFDWVVDQDESPRAGEHLLRASKKTNVLRYELNQNGPILRIRVHLNSQRVPAGA